MEEQVNSHEKEEDDRKATEEDGRMMVEGCNGTGWECYRFKQIISYEKEKEHPPQDMKADECAEDVGKKYLAENDDLFALAEDDVDDILDDEGSSCNDDSPSEDDISSLSESESEDDDGQDEDEEDEEDEETGEDRKNLLGNEKGMQNGAARTQEQPKEKKETKEGTPAEEEKKKWSREAVKQAKYLHQSSDKLLRRARHEYINQESTASFFVVDGDTLLYDAYLTETCDRHQQLHLFYIIELYISRLQQHIGRCEVVFFKDMEKCWYGPTFRLFRCALVKHLSSNCGITVHSEWDNMFSEGWKQYLDMERPSFIHVHDGCGATFPKYNLFRILALICLGQKLDVAFASNVKVTSSKFYAVFAKTNNTFVQYSNVNKNFLMKFWRFLLPLPIQPETHYKGALETDLLKDVNMRDALFIESAFVYWEKLTPEERTSGGESRVLSKWAHYFAAMSVCTLSERISAVQTFLLNIKNTPKENQNQSNVWKAWNRFVICMLGCFRNERFSNLTSNTDNELVDLLDENLFLSLFDLQNDDAPFAYFSANVIDRYSTLINLLQKRGVSFQPSQVLERTGTANDIIQEEEEPYKLAVIRCRLADDYIGNMKGTMNVTEDIFEFQEARAFDEKYHWHSGKPLNDDLDHFMEEPLSKNPRQRFWQLKQEQNFSKHLTMYGSALENGMNPITIASSTSSGKTASAKSAGDRKGRELHDYQKKSANKKKTKGLTADEIKRENDKRLKADELKLLMSKWEFLRTDFDKTIDDVNDCIDKVTKFLKDNSLFDKITTFEDPWVYLLNLQWQRWEKCCNVGEKNFAYAAEFIHCMHLMLQKEVSEKARKVLAKYFRKLGYEDIARLIVTHFEVKTISDKTFIGKPYNIFQMQHMGHLMKRDERSDPDPRVSSFIPDTWQRELLDVVDNNESALIVAPTSSGKTFCSYYAMETMLREGNDAIVVYVSPTKALVNQVQAAIYARFRKNMPDGHTLVGTFTRDYEHHSMTCQILVTVPQCLEILLLSPKRQKWVSRLRYVILDEIHCIGSEIGGEVWEHLITLIRCPFLALSATIGNPHEFHSWLSSAQAFKYNQECIETNTKSSITTASVRLVMYKERYSDIVNSIYYPETAEEEDCVVVTHPCTFLDGLSLSQSGFPGGMSLSPNESYQLWIASRHVYKDNTEIQGDLNAFSPTVYFSGLYITKGDARGYEVRLKKKVSDLLKDNQEMASQLIGFFRDQLPDDCGDYRDKYVTIPGTSELDFDIYKHFPALLERLKEADKLPVLVFMNDRTGVEDLAKELKGYADKATKEALSKIQKDIDRAAKLNDLLAEYSRAARDKNGSGRDIDDENSDFRLNRNVDRRSADRSADDGVSTVAYSEENLAFQNELQRIKLKIKRVKRKWNYVSLKSSANEDVEQKLEGFDDADFKDLIKMGIGFHHSGLNAKRRKAVEMLFQLKYVQVVSATATLALGIHMPCKTVVFVGDDHYVDALQYRQMSGRSGRRGFDNIGNVVFYGVPVRKISTLLKADLSNLTGCYPISCTLVLRLLLLSSNSNNENDAYKKAMTVLSLPFFTHQKETQQKQLQHFFLFVVDHLIRQLLIDGQGVPLQFAGLVCHLHYMEPGNMVFVHLLRKGLFHEICKPMKRLKVKHYEKRCFLCHVEPIVGNMYHKKDTNIYLCSNCLVENERNKVSGRQAIYGHIDLVEPPLKHTYSKYVLRKLVLILCHLFCKREIPSVWFDYSQRLKIPNKYGSSVVLNVLPPKFVEAITRYNDSVKLNFANYLCLVSKSLEKKDSVCLPVSQLRWSVQPNDGGASAIMPFVQLSGIRNEDLKTYAQCPEELFRTLPPDIFMDFKSIPAIDLLPVKNAYALDFFKHGSRKALLLDNRMQSGEIFDALKDFMLLTKTIATALEQLGPEETDDHVIGAFKHLAYEYSHKFQKVFHGR